VQSQRVRLILIEHMHHKPLVHVEMFSNFFTCSTLHFSLFSLGLWINRNCVIHKKSVKFCDVIIIYYSPSYLLAQPQLT
jgi:hypothetical protein